MEQGYVKVPYKIITPKVIVTDASGTHTYWQFHGWKRIKYLMYKLFHKTKKL